METATKNSKKDGHIVSNLNMLPIADETLLASQSTIGRADFTGR